MSADVVLVGSRFQSLMVLGKNDCPQVSVLDLFWQKRFLPLIWLSFGIRYCCLSMSIRSCWILNSMLSLADFLRSSRFSHFKDFTIFVTQPGVRSVQLLCTNLAALFCTCSMDLIFFGQMDPKLCQHIPLQVLLQLYMLLTLQVLCSLYQVSADKSQRLVSFANDVIYVSIPG